MRAIREICGLAIWGVLSYRFRVALLSITLGCSVASIVLTAAIGVAFEEEIQRLSFGAYARSLVISENVFAQDNVGPPTLADYRDLTSGSVLAGEVESATAWRSSVIAIRANGNETTALLLGAIGAYRVEADMPLASGRYLTEREMSSALPVCMIGAELKANLFGDESPVGDEINLNGVLCEIVGVFASPETRTALRFSNSVIAPFHAAARYFRGTNEIGPHETSWLTITFATDAALDDDRIAADRYLRRTHGVSQARISPFQFADPASPAHAVRRQQRLITTLLSGVSVVTLCAGLVGYGAIVWGMTQVRRRSIAIMMSCGFLPREVAAVFIIETLIAGAIGGGIGLGLAAIGARGVDALVHLDAKIDVWLSLGAVLFGVLCGVLAGALPALRAAATQPAIAARG